MLKSQTRRFLLLSILIFAGFLSACTTVKEASIAAVCPAYQVCQQCPAVPTTPPLQPAAKPMAAARWSDIPLKQADGSLERIGQSLLSTYSMSFELISVVLLVAMVGALVLAREGRDRQ